MMVLDILGLILLALPTLVAWAAALFFVAWLLFGRTEI